MNNADYWERRIKIAEDALKDKSFKYVRNLEEQFDATINQINIQMRAWYQRFATNNGISYAEAQKLLTSTELKEFKWTVQEYIKYGKENALNSAWTRELENASARVHISRLDALKYQLRQHAEALTQAQIKATSKASRLAYTQSYYHTAFEIQRGFGVGWAMQTIDSEKLKKILSHPWTVDGQTFIARCWNDKAKLVETINQELTRMIAIGEPPDKAITTISKRFGVSKQNAGRVVMTESAYFASSAQKACFAGLDVKQYRILGTIDTSTCDLCGNMDGKVFKMSDYKEGSTAPPFHPWCRCCTAPYFEDMEKVGERYARNIANGTSYSVPRDMSYNEWKVKQDKIHGNGTVDKFRNIEYNEKVDRVQYKKYRSVLGEAAPKTFIDFQSIKYSDEYSALKIQYADAKIQQRIINGEVNTTVLAGKQGKHVLGHNNYIHGRSYVNSDIDIQSLVNKYAGKGTMVRDSSGKWNRKEIVTADVPIGFAVSQLDGSVSQTSAFTIHYSKKGVHIVPKKE